jgi:RNA polymerase sigma-70 factor (family 1)
MQQIYKHNYLYMCLTFEYSVHITTHDCIQMDKSIQVEDLKKRIALFDDQQAYRELFMVFYTSLQQFAFSILRSKQLAEEAVSDVFIKIWEKRSSLDTIDNLKFYLFASTRNTSLNYLKKQEGLRKINADDYWVELHSIYFDPEQLMLTAEMISRVMEAINSLPPRCKLIFKLVKEEGLKYREVSELLDLSIKTVENQMTLALKKLGSAIGFDIYKSVSSTIRSPR